MSAVIGLLAFLAYSMNPQNESVKHPIYANSEDPNNYLMHINAAFQYFHRQYGYYPEYWYDIQNNCRQNPKAALCEIERGHSEAYRKTADFPSGTYKYVISSSGKRHYSVKAYDRAGCPRYVVREDSKVKKIVGNCGRQ